MYLNHPEHAGSHYAIREEGDLKAVVGAFPLEFEVCEIPLKVTGIGSVSTHPESRGQGHMGFLLQQIAIDMRNEGVAFSTLSGQRQRYENYGFTNLGQLMSFALNKQNIKHRIKRNEPIFNFVEMSGSNIADLKVCLSYNNRMPLNSRRHTPESFLEIINSWDSTPYFVYQGVSLAGYITAKKNQINEVFVFNEENFVDVIADFTIYLGEYEITLELLPHQQKEIAELSEICERFSVKQSGTFFIIDYPKVIQSFLIYKSTYSKLEDGSFVIEILDHGRYEISVVKGHPYVVKTRKKANYLFNHIQASMFLFSFSSLYDGSYDRLPAAAKSWLPIPIFFPKMDNV